MFAELVCGPPGSGKTTYCEGKRQFLSVYDPLRPVVMINFDPANEFSFPYPCDVDIREFVSLGRIMEEEQLGPNGSYLFAADVIRNAFPDVVSRIQHYVAVRRREVAALPRGASTVPGGVERAPYLLIDCPGQVEFYLFSDMMRDFTALLQKRLGCAVCTVHLADALVSSRDLGSYVSTCLLALSTMTDLELPHVNVLTKWDCLMEAAPFSPLLQSVLPNTTRVQDEAEKYSYLLDLEFLEEGSSVYATAWASRTSVHAVQGGGQNTAIPADHTGPAPAGKVPRWASLSAAILGVVRDYGLVSFVPLNVQSQEHMLTLTQKIDCALGNFV
jgi:GTPase SAR1 family protein